MKTIMCTNTIPWFSPLFEFSLFEPILEYSSLQTESISETPFAYNYSYTLPDFRKKDLVMSLQNNVLTIEGTNKNKGSWWNSNTGNSIEKHFVKNIRLSSDMNLDNINASFQKGVLKVEIPKKEEYVSYREIPVFGDSSNATVLEEKNNKPKNILNEIKLRINNLFKNTA
ncbi:Hsp20 family protein [Carboxylicivirga sp. A043]|uniref:HSP20 family small heat-shock protein n=1 Tax=Carboxylicivirga litoralis TaxID=2816963 RepID=UPI0021CB1C89|nr:HSP20 family small heat-shock protein [Carboxylicivirga sp. A043]MCU4156836.1 Hsp20 family protein [Carboxylicivirga sp. A043]